MSECLTLEDETPDGDVKEVEQHNQQQQQQGGKKIIIDEENRRLSEVFGVGPKEIILMEEKKKMEEIEQQALLRRNPTYQSINLTLAAEKKQKKANISVDPEVMGDIAVINPSIAEIRSQMAKAAADVPLGDADIALSQNAVGSTPGLQLVAATRRDGLVKAKGTSVSSVEASIHAEIYQPDAVNIENEKNLKKLEKSLKTLEEQWLELKRAASSSMPVSEAALLSNVSAKVASISVGGNHNEKELISSQEILIQIFLMMLNALSELQSIEKQNKVGNLKFLQYLDYTMMFEKYLPDLSKLPIEEIQNLYQKFIKEAQVQEFNEKGLIEKYAYQPNLKDKDEKQKNIPVIIVDEQQRNQQIILFSKLYRMNKKVIMFFIKNKKLGDEKVLFQKLKKLSEDVNILIKHVELSNFEKSIIELNQKRIKQFMENFNEQYEVKWEEVFLVLKFIFLSFLYTPYIEAKKIKAFLDIAKQEQQISQNKKIQQLSQLATKPYQNYKFS